jgi:hypothetical protein
MIVEWIYERRKGKSLLKGGWGWVPDSLRSTSHFEGK